jgi:hypothetical protein
MKLNFIKFSDSPKDMQLLGNWNLIFYTALPNPKACTCSPCTGFSFEKLTVYSETKRKCPSFRFAVGGFEITVWYSKARFCRWTQGTSESESKGLPPSTASVHKYLRTHKLCNDFLLLRVKGGCWSLSHFIITHVHYHTCLKLNKWLWFSLPVNISIKGYTCTCWR